MFERNQVKILASRLNEPVHRLIVVTGPRQTGKTTLVLQSLKRARSRSEYRYIPLDEPVPPSPILSLPDSETVSPGDATKRNSVWLTEQWEKARREADDSERGFVLVLDEIQKIPQWSETVKGLWDADRAAKLPLHVVLLGSAPLLMQRGLTESLAGRFELIRTTHWSFLEMHRAFDLDLSGYVYFGGYPGAAPLIPQPIRWTDYVRSALIEPNIEKDILMMTRVDKPALLKQLFELGCSYSGQILSYTKMLGLLQDAGNTTTLSHYLHLLTNAGLLTGLQKFASQHYRRRASSPKLNVLNTALMAIASGYTFDQARADRTYWGRFVESAVGAHLYNTGTPDIRLYYWRDSPYEVDFIIERGDMRVAIEVTSTARDAHQRGLAAFQDRFHPHRTILVGDRGRPLDEFLSSTPDEWFDST